MASWVGEIGFPQLSEVFEENMISGIELIDLTSQEVSCLLVPVVRAQC